jgi:putative transposase
MTQPSPFRYFQTSPEIIRLAVMLYIRCPLSLRNVEDLLHERGIEISHEWVDQCPCCFGLVKSLGDDKPSESVLHHDRCQARNQSQ